MIEKLWAAARTPEQIRLKEMLNERATKICPLCFSRFEGEHTCSIAKVAEAANGR